MRYLTKTAMIVLLCLPGLLWAQLVIIDAGSSGTRLHRYAQQGRHRIQETIYIKKRPGLAAFVTHDHGTFAIDQNALTAYLQAMVNDAKDQGLTGQDSMHLYATAGVRLLAPVERQQLFDAVRGVFSQMGFSDVKVALIDGEQEAVYDWLSANEDCLLHDACTESSVGVVDMGGASMEVAFEMPADAAAPSESSDTVDVVALGKHHRLVAKSYLGLGKDEALGAMHDTDAASTLFCFPNGVFPVEPTYFNWRLCRATMQGFFDRKLLSNQHGLHASAMPTNFVLMGALYFNSKFVGHAGVDQWPNDTQAICQGSWSDLKAQYPKNPEVYLKQDCQSVVYGHGVLESLGLLHKTLSFAKYDWARGAALAAFSGNDMPGV